MRHKVVREYFGIDEDVVWRVATEGLHVLIAALEPIVSSESSD